MTVKTFSANTMREAVSQVKKELEEGTTILGGCVTCGNEPDWMCLDCKTKMFKPYDPNGPVC